MTELLSSRGDVLAAAGIALSYIATVAVSWHLTSYWYRGMTGEPVPLGWPGRVAGYLALTLIFVATILLFERRAWG
jgi:hypothetical protein